MVGTWIAPALAGTYDLVIDRTSVRIDGQERRVFSINGQIAAPVLRWKEGEDVVVNVTNRLPEDTSFHWHGILLPAATPRARSRRGCMPRS